MELRNSSEEFDCNYRSPNCKIIQRERERERDPGAGARCQPVTTLPVQI